MKTATLPIPGLMLLVGTRAALGVGIGLLLAGTMDRNTRKGAGLALLAVGVLSTIPLAIGLIGHLKDGEP
jgi:hypothetical protein